jgi:hypothetical protein
VKTTVEIPHAIFRKPKSAAAEHGIPLREFVTEPVREKLAASMKPTSRLWLKSMGKLKRPHKETERINRWIEAHSERIDEEMWR